MTSRPSSYGGAPDAGDDAVTGSAVSVPLEDAGWDRLLRDVALGRLQLSLRTADGLQIALLAQPELQRLQAAAGESVTASARGNLSNREHEVLLLVADGLTSSQIAQQLGLAANTVAQHLHSARRKLGVKTTRAAVALVTQQGAQ